MTEKKSSGLNELESVSRELLASVWQTWPAWSLCPPSSLSPLTLSLSLSLSLSRPLSCNPRRFSGRFMRIQMLCFSLHLQIFVPHSTCVKLHAALSFRLRIGTILVRSFESSVWQECIPLLYDWCVGVCGCGARPTVKAVHMVALSLGRRDRGRAERERERGRERATQSES